MWKTKKLIEQQLNKNTLKLLELLLWMVLIITAIIFLKGLPMWFFIFLQKNKKSKKSTQSTSWKFRRPKFQAFSCRKYTLIWKYTSFFIHGTLGVVWKNTFQKISLPLCCTFNFHFQAIVRILPLQILIEKKWAHCDIPGSSGPLHDHHHTWRSVANLNVTSYRQLSLMNTGWTWATLIKLKWLLHYLCLVWEMKQ